jgi:predicted TIM-barrel fold metal-dependent hydrolase
MSRVPYRGACIAVDSGALAQGGAPVYDGVLVVDSDGHLVEHSTVYDGRIDPRHLEHAPRVLRMEDGRQGFSFFGMPPARGDFGPGDAITPGGLQQPRGLDWDEGQPGGFDPERRLADMDIEGIDAAVLFPTLGLFLSLVPEAEAAVAIARVLNDRALEYCGTDRARLFPVGVLPLKDVAAAVAELQRCAGAGFPAVVVRPNPDPHTQRRLDDPGHEPLWHAAAEAGLTLCVHEGVNPLLPFAGLDRCPTMFDWHCVSHPFEQMLAMLALMRAGVMERHPSLRFGFMEANCGWVPYWLERLDSNWHNLGSRAPEIRRPPSEYFQRQCAVTCEADEVATATVCEAVGDGHVMWASDYPHFDAEFPGAVKEMFERGDLSPERRARVMGANAVDFFRLPLRAATQSLPGSR